MENNYLDNYKLIVVFIKKGRALNLIKKLKKVGLQGSVTLYGKGVAEKRVYEQILGLKYEPEKEIILMAMDSTRVDKILDTVVEEEQLNIPGHGIAIVLNLNKCVGIARLINCQL
ncbi:MAG: P-II family nitrogen regulator [Bacilli bacterium]|nr:P-II family nitrogen regulator [Bacilli bacterium]MDD4608334.1 P-II family nitrogen regulator [Bacilli bacterium]